MRDESKIIDAEAVHTARQSLPSEYSFAALELFYKVFADTTRIKILFALKEVELCVYDICAALSLKQSTVSQQLRFLRQTCIVKSRQEGKNVYYSLDDNHITSILLMGLEHINEKR
ncbi:ArsR/SmtB family transcription factor [Mucispirillum schaedleri]|jgi:ArsR family transcriptional regulator|uniref:Transcriptional repressor SmtB n=1 Tax=Mucispirillum schaedleri ASF457 TaxID=1379858 RepID=V2QH36_9BACT|nr:metalloregulator ArsR/SmtB family transcription factor [Mucispirillum schaedleri]MCX4360521.1 metalloregulator ArsR/SmtB family transcription factor [Mucispirillum schaedleri]USF23650.1 Transcriptional repressor SmtB [Mucispirillum schaedleri ASF457]SIW05433.1 conserved hypothetical protein [Mucispirillum schaedleri ASF457]